MNRTAWAARVFVLLLGIALAAKAVSEGLARAMVTRAPSMAVRLAPHDALVANRASDYAMYGQKNPDFARAKRLAMTAVERDLTSVAAVRNLGLVAEHEGDKAGAVRLLRHAEQISRRDLATQVWLINAEIMRGEPVAALGHFDTAMRTSKTSWSLLMPVLTRALEDRRVLQPLTHILLRRPFWAPHFLRHAVQNSTRPADVAALIAILLRRGEPLQDEMLAELTARLAGDGRYREALDLYRLVAGRDPDPAASAFDRAGKLPPLDWKLSDATARTTIARSPALRIEVSGQEARPAARRVYALPQGRYRLVGAYEIVEGPEGSGLSITVRCASGSAELLRLRGDLAKNNTATIAKPFAVPAKCPFQVLDLNAESGELASASISLALTRLAITPSR